MLHSGATWTIRSSALSASSPQGPAQVLCAGDIVGTSEQIAGALHGSPRFSIGGRGGLRLAVDADPDDYVQILAAMAERLGTVLG